MSTSDEDIAKIIEGLVKASNAVPAVLAEARSHLPEELWGIFDAQSAPILAAAAEEEARRKFAEGFAGILQSFKDGHGPMGKHSGHAG